MFPLWIIWEQLQCFYPLKNFFWYPLHLAYFLVSSRYSINLCGMKEYLNEQSDVLKYVFPLLLKCRARISRTKSSNSLGTCTTTPFPSCPSFVALWFASELHASGKCQISAQQTFLYSRYHCLRICHRLGGFCSGTRSLCKGQALGVKIYEFSKYLLREHTVCQTALGGYCSSKN